MQKTQKVQKISEKKRDIKAQTKTDKKAEVIEQLTALMKIYQAKGDRGRVIGYGKGISGIKAHPGPIMEPKDLDGIPGVGKAIKDKTAEWFDSGKISKLDSL